MKRERDAKALLVVLAVLAMFIGIGFAAEQKPEPPKTPAPVSSITASNDIQLKILKAQHALDEINTQMAGLQQKWNDIQNQMRDIQSQAQPLTKQQSEAQAALDKEVDAAFTAANVDKTKFDFDRKSLTFVPKVSPAPPTPSPEKK